MEQITNVNELVDWIYNNSPVCNPEVDDNSIYFQGQKDSSITINYEEDDCIDEIILKVIKTLENFDADDQFMELWSKDFSERNHFKPSQFIKMLQEDEASFKELAGELRKIIN